MCCGANPEEICAPAFRPIRDNVVVLGERHLRHILLGKVSWARASGRVWRRVLAASHAAYRRVLVAADHASFVSGRLRPFAPIGHPGCALRRQQPCRIRALPSLEDHPQRLLEHVGRQAVLTRADAMRPPIGDRLVQGLTPIPANCDHVGRLNANNFFRSGHRTVLAKKGKKGRAIACLSSRALVAAVCRATPTRCRNSLEFCTGD